MHKIQTHESILGHDYHFDWTALFTLRNSNISKTVSLRTLLLGTKMSPAVLNSLSTAADAGRPALYCLITKEQYIFIFCKLFKLTNLKILAIVGNDCSCDKEPLFSFKYWSTSSIWTVDEFSEKAAKKSFFRRFVGVLPVSLPLNSCEFSPSNKLSVL